MSTMPYFFFSCKNYVIDGSLPVYKMRNSTKEQVNALAKLPPLVCVEGGEWWGWGGGCSFLTAAPWLGLDSSLPELLPVLPKCRTVNPKCRTAHPLCEQSRAKVWHRPAGFSSCPSAHCYLGPECPLQCSVQSVSMLFPEEEMKDMRPVLAP